MEIKFKVCSCYNPNLWKDFVEALEEKLNKKINLSTIENLSNPYQEEADIFYAPFPFSLELFRKNYLPIASFKGQKDFYFIIGNSSLDRIKNKEKIRIFIINSSFHYFLLFYISHYYNLDFSKIHIALSSSYNEIAEKILEKKGDLGIVPEIVTKFYHFPILEKLPLELNHIFSVSSSSPYFSEIKNAFFTLEKESIKVLGFEDLEIISPWKEAFIRNTLFFSNFVSKIVEKSTILETFLSSPYFGIGIYRDTYIYANPYLCKLLGYSLKELQKLLPEEIIYYEKDRAFARKIVKRRLRGKFFILPYEEITLRTKEGKKVEALVFSNTIFYKNQYHGMIVVIDITKKKILQKFVNLLRKINQILITCNKESEVYEKVLPEIYESLELKSVSIIIYENNTIKSLFCYPEKSKFLNIYRHLIDLQKNIKIIADVRNSELPNKEYFLSSGITSICIIPILKQNEIRSFLILCSEEPEIFNNYKDFLEELQKDLSFVLEKVELISKSFIVDEFIKTTDEILIVADEKGNIERINPFGINLLTKIEENPFKKKLFSLFHLPKNLIENLEKHNQPLRNIGIFSKPGKEKLLLELKISLINLPDETKKLIVVGKDLTKELEFEEERQSLQYYDTLTEVFNRAGFFKKVSELLTFLKSKGLLVLIDLYNFTYINHFYGSEVGDFILKELTKNFKNCLKKEGIIGRTGGDEFALFIIDVEKEEISKWLNKIKNIFSEPLKYKEKLIFLEFNIGVVIYPEDGKTFNTLWEKSNIVLREAKKKGANTIEFSNPVTESEVEKIFKIDTLIKRAFKENLFVFYYQPYFEINSLKIAGLEALVRIKDKDKLVLPSEFIKYLENSPYLLEFELFALKKHLENLKRWNIPISINISSKTFKTLNFEEVFSFLKDYLTNSFITFEITEHILVENIKLTEKILKTIKSLGIKIALDDFGTGYSSLYYLKDLPIDILKIDMSFTKAVVNNPKAYLIVKNIISLAHDLNIKTIAEGIETENQLKVFKKIKCDYVQGFLLAKPMSEEDIENFLNKS